MSLMELLVCGLTKDAPAGAARPSAVGRDTAMQMSSEFGPVTDTSTVAAPPAISVAAPMLTEYWAGAAAVAHSTAPTANPTAR